MYLYWGCFFFIYDKLFKDNVLEEYDERFEFVLNMGKRMGFMKFGNMFVFVFGWKVGVVYINIICILIIMEEKIYIVKSLLEFVDFKGKM